MMKQDMFGCNNSTDINQIVFDHDHVNPSSLEGHEDNSYLHYFPDPFLDDDDLFLSHFLSQQQQQQQDQLFSSGGDCCWDEEQEEEKKEEHGGGTSCEVKRKMKMNNKKKKKKCNSSSNRKNGSSGRNMRSTGKKDRHSKICTAQGPRDRRMRLSLQIARKFFDLQDMLGFDKASKTIEWLLSNSNSAIKDLKHSFLLNNNSSSSSGFSYVSVYSGSSEAVSEIIRDNNAVGVAPKEEAAFMGTLNSTRPFLRTVARESRDRARARARQRTILKKTEQQQQQQPTNSTELQQNTQLQDCPSIHPKVFPISDHHHLSDFPTIHTLSSGNNNNNNITQFENLDFPTLSCPNSIFIDSPFPKPYSFSDSTLLKLP